VTYVFIADMAKSIRAAPGLIDIGPWVEHDGERVVGVSRWESREAFEAARASAPDSARSVVPRA